MTTETAPAYRVTTRHKRMLADIITPVSIYLRIRDRFLNSILLESSDYHGNDNSFSYLAFDPVARFSYDRQRLTVQLPGQPEQVQDARPQDVLPALQQFKETGDARSRGPRESRLGDRLSVEVALKPPGAQQLGELVIGQSHQRRAYLQ